MVNQQQTPFPDGPIVDRAAALLTWFSGSPLESVSRLNTAVEIANSVSRHGAGIGPGGVLGGGRDERARALRSVSEAWQLLERAGLVCKDLEQSRGDWWLLTGAGAKARGADDIASAVARALAVPE